MEDDFQLISKKVLKDLKDENQRLKNEIVELKKNSPKTTTSQKTEPVKAIPEKDNTDKIKEIIAKENEKLKLEILSKIQPLEELNKSALNNVVGKIHTIDGDLKNVVTTLNELVTNLGELIELLPENISQNASEPQNEPKTTNKEEFEKIKNIIDSADDSTYQEIKIYLKNIDEFMKNLKQMLSVVDMSSIKSNSTQANKPQNQNSNNINDNYY